MQPHPIAWLDAALPGLPGDAGRLAAARLAGAEQLGRGGFALSSAAFAEGEALDPCFTAEEEDPVAPPLAWTAPPAGTCELVLLVEDVQGRREAVCHWLAWGFAPAPGQVLEGELPPRVGKNSAGNGEWLPPAPPPGGPAHHYVFQLFALDCPLALGPGASRAALFEVMAGHVLGLALLRATFAASPEDEGEDETDRD